jgi:hypothetical protein
MQHQTASVHEVQLPAAMIADNLHDLNPIGGGIESSNAKRLCIELY